MVAYSTWGNSEIVSERQKWNEYVFNIDTKSMRFISNEFVWESLNEIYLFFCNNNTAVNILKVNFSFKLKQMEKC